MTLNQADLNQLLHKVGTFTKIAVSTISDLREEINSVQTKEASELAREKRLVKRASELLYDADFIVNETERTRFLKQAEADPIGTLTRALEKVCKAADVALIGAPARSATTKPKLAEYDPVAARAFGLYPQRFLD